MNQKSLSFHVSIWTGIVIAISMAVYAVFQYITQPDMTFWSLFINHLWHVLVLGVLIYALCWLVFQKRLIAPFNAIAGLFLASHPGGRHFRRDFCLCIFPRHL